MSDVVIELAKQVPAALAVMGVVWLFLRYMESQELKRSANAKEIGETYRAHEIHIQNISRGRDLEMNNLWASTVKNIMQNQDVSAQAIVSALATLEKNITESYEKLGVTQDLLKAARAELKIKKRNDE